GPARPACPYTPLSRSAAWDIDAADHLVTHGCGDPDRLPAVLKEARGAAAEYADLPPERIDGVPPAAALAAWDDRAVDSWQQRLRSEEHTSELQSRENL